MIEWLADNGYRAEAATGLDIASRIDQPLGCGAFGCVFKTSDPKWVLKVTDDPDEGPLMASIIALRRKHGGGSGYGPNVHLPGIVFVRNLFQAFWEEEEPIYVIVREEVKPWESYDWHRMVYYDAERVEVDGDKELLYADPVPAPPDIRGLTSMTIVQEYAKKFNRVESEQAKEAALLKYVEWLEIAGEELPLVSESMLELFDNEIVLEDVHEANLGYARVNWGPKYRQPGRVIIHDVGMSETPFRPRFRHLNPVESDASFGIGRYTWMPLDQVLAWEPIAAELGVSKIARSKDGFTRAYETATFPEGLSPYWLDKRERFIARHVAQAKANGEPWFRKGMPTRRHLALIMWGYSPQPSKLPRPGNRGRELRANPIRPNPTHDAPDWLRFAVERAEPRIVKLHGRQMLPESWDMFGCGGFGCVLPTRKPGWVCKVSIEGSEAFFARAQAKLDLYPPGVCRYMEPIEVETGKGPVWIMWRQAIESENFRDWRDSHRTPPDLEAKIEALEWNEETSKSAFMRKFKAGQKLREDWEREQGTDAYEILEALQQQGLRVAATFSWFCENVDDRPYVFAKMLADRAEPAKAIFEPSHDRLYWHYTSKEIPRDDHLLDAAVGLLGFRYHLAQLEGHKLMGPLAAALKAYLDKGLLLADAQPDNIAMVGGVWTLFDAGFTVPVSTRWNAMWLDVDPQTDRWFGNKRWDLWNELRKVSGSPGYVPNPLYR